MLRLFIFPAILISGLACFSCCPKETARTPEKQSAPSGTLSAASSATAVKNNAAVVDAIVDSVNAGAGGRYSLTCRLVSAAGVSGLPSFAQTGQQVTLEPDTESDNSGADEARARNLRLAAAGKLKPGDRFSGTISLRPDGRWYLLDCTIQP
jgi:hypothetical protein